MSIFACIANATNLTYRPRGTYQYIPLPEAVWHKLLTVTGDSIWVGYENGGWDIPADAQQFARLRGEQNETPVMAWFWESPSQSAFVYVLVFDNTEPFAAPSGEHYGIHPCNGFRVNRTAVLALFGAPHEQ